MQTQQSMYRNPNLQVVFGITLMGIMGVSLIAPTLNATAQALDVSRESAALVITAFTLPGAILAVFAGIIADKYGRRHVIIPSLLLFAISGGLTVLVSDFTALIVLRILQGTGAAALAGMGTVLIGDRLTGITRARAMGANASVLSLGTGLFPFFGGALALASWNYPYLLFLLALPVAFIAWRYVKEPELDKGTRMLPYLKIAASYMRSPRALAAFAAGIITFIILYGTVLTFFGFLLANRFGASPFIIGIFFSAMSLTTAAFSTQAGRLAAKTTKRNIIGTGFLLFATGLAIVPLISNMWLLLIPIIIFGIGMGFNVPALQTLVTELAPAQYRGAMVSIYGVMIRIGQSLGPALLGVVLGFFGLPAVFYLSSALAFITGITGMVLALKSRAPVAGG